MVGALGGDDQEAWMGMLAQGIVKAEWNSEERADAMLASLLALPPHLLHRCLAACVPLWAGLHEALQLLPQPLHYALVASFATEGTLEVPIMEGIELLRLLSAITVSLSGLEGLKLGCEDDSYNHECSLGEAAVLTRAPAPSRCWHSCPSQ